MKFREIFRYEIGYQAQRFTTWLYFLTLFLFGLLIMRSFTPEEGVFLNSPSLVVFVTVMGGVIWLFLAAPVAGEAAARDLEGGMHPLTFTTPVSKAEYLGGRFLAALTLNALMLLGLQAGILLSLLLPHSQPELIGPYIPLGHLAAYFVIALPNALVATAIQFSTALRARRAIITYVASVLFLFTSLFVSTAVGNYFDNWELGTLFDGIGFVGVMRELETWTPIDMNSRVIGLEGPLLANRAFLLVVAFGTLAFTYHRFQFNHPVGPPSRFARRRGSARQATASPPRHVDAAIDGSTTISVPQVDRRFDFANDARQTLTVAWTSFLTIARSRGGLTLVAILSLGAAFFSTEWLRFLEEIPLLPRTEEVIAFFTLPLGRVTSLWIVIPLLIIFYAGEVIWQERDAGVSEIVDTSPVSEWVLFLGKFLGLGLVIVVWLAIQMVGGVLIQIYLGHPDFNWGLYVKAFFGFQLAEYLLFALLVLMLHAVIDQKYVGYFAALTAYGFIAFAPSYGIQHKLLVYGAAPPWSYSPMRGLAPTVEPWLWFKAYWAAWALLLATVAILFFARGRETRLGLRFRMARHRFTGATVAVAAAALTLIIAVGGFVFYNTNVLNAYRTADESMERRAEYERRYGQYQGTPQPRLTGTTLRVEIYPERREVEIRGTYQLVNHTAVAIAAIHVAPSPDVETGTIVFDRSASRVLADDDLAHRIYGLEKPLQPGESLSLDFDVKLRSRGFTNSGVDLSVVSNGTYFKNDVLPAIGYQWIRELSSVGDRRLHGLPPRPEIPSLYGNESPPAPFELHLSGVETIVGTVEDQTAIGPGMLRRTWSDHGRRYFHYATEAPIGNEYLIASAKYAVREAEWSGSGQTVAIEMFHHPTHTLNVDRTVRSAKDALRFYTRHFGPYPFRHVRFIEHPGWGRGAHADGNTIDFMEGFSLLNPHADRDVDLPYHIVAHEVAHQWWGTQVSPAYVEGAGLLVESLATYSAMLVGADTIGAEHLHRYLRFVRLEYEIPRSPAMPPLLQAAESFLNYRKGPLALYALGEYIGQARVIEALRRLLEKHGPTATERPTSLDLYRELEAVTPDEHRTLLHDLFAANTFWKLEARSATAEQTASGEWQVTLTLRARKEVIDIKGVVTELPMDEWIEAGVFDPREGDDPGFPHSIQRFRIRSGEQTITLTSPREPGRAGIDPRFLLNDWAMNDNHLRVRVKKGS